MTDSNPIVPGRLLRRIGLAGGIARPGFWQPPLMDTLRPAAVQAQGTPSFWSSAGKTARITEAVLLPKQHGSKGSGWYFLMLKPKDRKSAILKLSITVPEYFNAKIKPSRVSLCRMQLGGMLARSRCKETLPAVIEVNETQTAIEVFPEAPIPTGGTYAVVMKIFNPSNSGMFQFNALAQAPGDVPVAGYLGSWLIDIEQ